MARLAAAALDELAEPIDLWQLKLALRAFDRRLANLAARRRRGPFRDLDDGGARPLPPGLGDEPPAASAGRPSRPSSGWRSSSPTPTRVLDPRRTRRWDRDGLPTPLGAAGDRARRRSEPLAVDRSATASATRLELEADVVIVGSGAGGGVVAARVAAAGRSVLVVEAGSAWPEAEMPTDELTGFKRMFLARGLTANADLSIAILAGATLGGGMTVNWTTSIDAPDRPSASAGPRTTGSRASMAPRPTPTSRGIRAELQVGPADQHRDQGPAAHRGLPCPRLGGGAQRAEHDRLRRPAAAAASAAGAAPSGPASAATWPSPREHGARFLVDAPVDRVVFEGGRAVGVEGRLQVLDATGLPTDVERPFRVRARQVVVAAGALRTPVVLLASGRAHPWTGHGLRLHPVPAVAGMMQEPVEMWAGPLAERADRSQFLEPGPAAAGYAGPGPRPAS